jgi:RHS repeat-associated protein
MSGDLDCRTTHYTLDLAAGQRPLVATPHGPPEGGQGGASTHYLYGHEPLGEATAGWAFYLPDGMASFRQVTDLDGQVSLTRRFSPWGELLEQDGGGDFAWGYFGELLDAATGLIYLRARYYAPAQGRFLSRDAWEGDYSRPLSLNRWNYGEANPVIRIDPTGMWYCQSGIIPLTADCKNWVENALTRLESSGSTGKILVDYFHAHDRMLTIGGIGGALACTPLASWAAGEKINYVYPEYYTSRNYNPLSSIRRQYIDDQIKSIP